MSYDPDEIKRSINRLETTMREAFPPKIKEVVHHDRDDDNDKDDARMEISELKAAIELCKNNDWACMIYINGLSFGLCNNASIIPALNEEIAEREKFLRGEPNLWE